MAAVAAARKAPPGSEPVPASCWLGFGCVRGRSSRVIHSDSRKSSPAATATASAAYPKARSPGSRSGPGADQRKGHDGGLHGADEQLGDTGRGARGEVEHIRLEDVTSARGPASSPPPRGARRRRRPTEQVGPTAGVHRRRPSAAGGRCSAADVGRERRGADVGVQPLRERPGHVGEPTTRSLALRRPSHAPAGQSFQAIRSLFLAARCGRGPAVALGRRLQPVVAVTSTLAARMPSTVPTSSSPVPSSATALRYRSTGRWP